MIAAWIGLGILGILLMIAIPILVSVFWVWMIVDCAARNFKNKGDKVVWILIIILTHVVGAFIYYLVIKRKEKKA